MKKGILIFGLGLTTIGFISCGGSNTSEGEYTQAQLDSVKQATEDSIQRALELQQDSLLLEEALRHNHTTPPAGGGTKPSNKPSTTTPTPTPTETHSEVEHIEPVTKPGGLRGKSDQAKQEEAQSGGGGLRSKSDQAKQQETQSGGGGLRSKSDQAKQQGN